jgi:hypothetical protein
MNDERHFLHDLVGPLSTARTQMDLLLEQLQDAPNSQFQLKKLEAILKSIETAIDLVAARRELRVEMGARRENDK